MSSAPPHHCSPTHITPGAFASHLLSLVKSGVTAAPVRLPLPITEWGVKDAPRIRSSTWHSFLSLLRPMAPNFLLLAFGRAQILAFPEEVDPSTKGLLVRSVDLAASSGWQGWVGVPLRPEHMVSPAPAMVQSPSIHAQIPAITTLYTKKGWEKQKQSTKATVHFKIAFLCKG